jgi:hypothetical protein
MQRATDHFHQFLVAHAPRNAVSAAYNHALYLNPRARMMQDWADFLEHTLRGGKVVSFHCAEFRHFRYLLALVEHSGFRAAADFLRTSEPNLCVQARRFQEDLGKQKKCSRSVPVRAVRRVGVSGALSLSELCLNFRNAA